MSVQRATPNRSIRWLLALIASVVVASLPGIASAQNNDPLGDRISSKRYIVVDVDTGEIFAQRAADEKVAIASLTKIFTTIEALERAPLDTLITTDSSDLFDANSTTMGFGPGETFTLKDLIYGMLLPSGNDAAHAIARSLGAQPGDTDPEQSVGRFVGWMNQRIANMGLTETHLVNPHGLGVPGHYSSAHDLAAFTRYALRYPFFVQVISTSEYTTSNGAYTVTNTNKVLGTDSELIGGKTGYDDDAGYCLVQVYQRARTRVVTVTLDGVAPDVWYQDDSILADYGFRQKNARLAAGTPITGELAMFRDPDAARIQTFATPASSIGVVQPTPSPADSSTAVAAPSPTSATSTNAPPGGDRASGGRNGTVIAALAIAAVVVVAGIFATSRLGTRPPGSAGTPGD